MKKLLLVTVIIMLSGCASTMIDTAKTRYSFEFSCAEKELQVKELGRRSYGVSGCNKTAVYIMKGECSTSGSCDAILDSGKPEIKKEQ